MKLLLDTCSFLWFVNGELDKISQTAKDLFLNEDSEIFLSVVSCWEISIKWSIGKLELSYPPDVFLKTQIQRNQLSLLPIELEHAVEVTELPFHHRDPFDRLLVAQAIIEKFPLISVDKTLSQYDIERIW